MAAYDVFGDAARTGALKVVLGAEHVGHELVEREGALAAT